MGRSSELRYQVHDLFPAFLGAWEDLAGAGPEGQLDLWRRSLASCPGLLEKQLDCYREEGLDWREVVREHVLPFLGERLPTMAQAREALHRVIGPSLFRAQANLGLDFPVSFVIYVGMGCGAGWATELRGQPACLLGLENIAERGWLDEGALSGLVAHELGHLLHGEWRRRAGLEGIEEHRDPLWQLYVEGFAQRCEHLIAGEETWHEAHGQPGWLAWCRGNLPRLAEHFLERLEQGEVREFFGSWFDLEGWRQTGYFLGHELIRGWEGELSLQEIVVLPAPEARSRAEAFLRKAAH